MRDAVEAELNSVMNESLGTHPRTDAGFVQEIRDPVFDDARAHALLHVVEAPGFHDYRVNASLVEEVSEQKSGGTGADDHHLRAI
jgi:hypothetical protein